MGPDCILLQERLEVGTFTKRSPNTHVQKNGFNDKAGVSVFRKPVNVDMEPGDYRLVCSDCSYWLRNNASNGNGVDPDVRESGRRALKRPIRFY